MAVRSAITISIVKKWYVSPYIFLLLSSFHLSSSSFHLPNSGIKNSVLLRLTVLQRGRMRKYDYFPFFLFTFFLEYFLKWQARIYWTFERKKGIMLCEELWRLIKWGRDLKSRKKNVACLRRCLQRISLEFRDTCIK